METAGGRVSLRGCHAAMRPLVKRGAGARRPRALEAGLDVPLCCLPPARRFVGRLSPGHAAAAFPTCRAVRARACRPAMRPRGGDPAAPCGADALRACARVHGLRAARHAAGIAPPAATIAGPFGAGPRRGPVVSPHVGLVLGVLPVLSAASALKPFRRLVSARAPRPASRAANTAPAPRALAWSARRRSSGT